MNILIAYLLVILLVSLACGSDELDAARNVASQHISTMVDNYPTDLLLDTALRVTGWRTERQLEILFRKCVAPDSRIVLGAIGGSITDQTYSYPHPLFAFLQKLCPSAQIELHMGAMAAHGSLTSGMCTKSGLGQHVDMLIYEFSLNDFRHYHRDGQTLCPSYEFAIRNALSSFQHTPAVFGLFFWGPHFTYDSAQQFHEKICEHYGLTGLSMRDVIWPYYSAKRKPYATKNDICADAHHPNAQVHIFTANLISLYISELFMKWSDKFESMLPSLKQSNLMPPAYLPKPISTELERFDLLNGSLQCRWAIDRGFGQDTKLQIYESDGWELLSKPPCIHFSDQTSTVILPVETNQGIVIMSNCHRAPGKYWEKSPAFQVNLLEKSGKNLTVIRTKISLLPFILGSGESFILDPPLSPGRHTLEVYPNPKCDRDPRNKGLCGGFYAVITL